MIFVFAIVIYCVLVIIKRILKPRVIPRLCDYNFENNLCFALICGIFVIYKLFIQKLSLEEFRRINVVSNK